MPEYTTADIRNLTVVGHAGAGKTTLVESLLAHCGAIDTPGSIERGSTVTDFEPQRKTTPAFDVCRARELRLQRQAHQFDRLPRLSRLCWQSTCDVACRGDYADCRGRARRRADEHAPVDGGGPGAGALLHGGSYANRRRRSRL